MEVDYNKKEKIVGTFVIGIVILLLTMLIVIGRGKDWFKTYITYYTTFEESYNLKENAAVKLYRTDIGKVKKITLAEDKVRVKLVILEDYSSRIRSDSVAVVDSPTFIGSEYISIIPGSADAPLIEKGGEISSREKKSVDDILAEFEVEKTAKMVIPAIQGIAEIAQIMRDPDGPLFTALDKLDKILENINKASLKAPGVMDQVQDNLAALKKLRDDVSESVSSIKRIIKQVEESHDVPEITRSVKNGIQEIRYGAEEIDKVVQSLQKNLLIKSNLPPEEEPENIDAGLRQ